MKKYTYTETKDTRSGFGAGLLEAARENENIVGLCADLTGSLKMNAFENEFPERFFQVGISEANMMSMAAGMTIGGKIPFTGTFANFSTSRVYDQIPIYCLFKQKCKNMRFTRRSNFRRRWSNTSGIRGHRNDENASWNGRH